MIQPVRLQLSRKRGAKLVSPNGLPNVIVERRSKWGNWFEVGEIATLADEHNSVILLKTQVTAENCL